ncbi:MAG: sigma-54-dependent Fis family transcriptional regulator [Desulfopila sp.]
MRTVDTEKIRTEWLKMSQRQPVDSAIVRPCVSASWQRSLELGVDPYVIDEENLLTDDEIIARCSLDHLQPYKEIITAIQDIAIEMDLTFEIFDRQAQLRAILAFPQRFYRQDGGFSKNRNIVFRDVSEEKIGTNSVILALTEGRPIQLTGPEHFKQSLHTVNCSAAPVHDLAGRIDGAINLSSHSALQTVETLALATSIARILDNHLTINSILGQMTIVNSALNKMIEYLPQGVIWCNAAGEVETYNRKIAPLLQLEKTMGRQEILALLKNIIAQIKTSSGESDVEQKEVVLDLGGSARRLLASIKNIGEPNRQINGQLIVLEDIDKILRSAYKGIAPLSTLADIVGETAKIVELKELAEHIARSPSAVLVFGESGTGKELFAQGIHNASLRRDKPFVAINCGAISSELIESELFGYEPGAFTGALRGGKIGKLEAASGGTLFLDEVESMPQNVQIKLLRALANSKITRVGSVKETPIDIRIISASKKDLLKEAEAGNFREDLYYRISTITLSIPPLNQRKEDIPLIVDYFVAIFSKQFDTTAITVEDEFIAALRCYDWRGNIRELRNTIERAMLLLGNRHALTIDTLPKRIVTDYEKSRTEELVASYINELKNVEGRDGILSKVERLVIESILQEEGGNISKAAEKLGISRPTLYKKVRKNSILTKL